MNEKVMVLKDKRTGKVIGEVPDSCKNSVRMAIRYLKGIIIRYGTTAIIKNKSYNYNDLTVVERVINYSRIKSIKNADELVDDCPENPDETQL